MGFDGSAAVEKAWIALSSTLESENKQYWSLFFQQHTDGIIQAGKLEKYLTGFIRSLDPVLQEKLRRLIEFTDVDEQRSYFLKELHHSVFRDQFIEYFDRQNLSKGRDPRLFRYAGESGGESFYLRLMQQLSGQLAKHNFFFRFFFFGPLHLPESILPPCYQKANFLSLREKLPKLKIVNGEAIDYLLSEEGRQINKASLSNIFEYTSVQEFGAVSRALFEDFSRPLKVIFWNLLQDQGVSQGQSGSGAPLREEVSDKLSRQEACFYFRNVRLMETVKVPLRA
jgi:S-adenosylmethionine-diacylglycerol 3-amino-3-carboxypropyl transferase